MHNALMLMVLAAFTSAAFAANADMSRLAPVGEARVGFSFVLGERVGTNVSVLVTAPEMESLSVVTNGDVVTATWHGHPKCGKDFTVAAHFGLLHGGGFKYGDFAYSGNESPLYVRGIAFPEVTVPRTDRTAIFRPHYLGEVFRPDWKNAMTGKVVSKSKPGMTFCFKCIATLNEGGVSHFLDQRGESRRYSTRMEVLKGEMADTLVMRNVYIPLATDALRKAGDFPVSGVYAPYRGGWYEAARMHRVWMETQPWFKAAAARDMSKLRDIDLWMWSRGGVDVSEPPVHWFMKETGLRVALDWYFWHNVPYDTCFPFFWPPRDGEAAFRAAVKRMKDAGAFVQVYTNGMLWDCDDGRWDEGGKEGTVIRADGELRATMFNPFTRQRQARMCGEASVFQRKMRDLEKTLASTGMDGVYMDMISCAACEPCFNTSHRHAPGGGSIMTDGYRAFIKDVHNDNPGLLLSSEATSEEYLDRFESAIVMFSSWERFGFGTMPEHEPVPAVSVIYKGAVALFGSFATPGGVPGWDPLWGKCEDSPDVDEIAAKYPDQFAVEFARGAVWGIQPMVHNFTMKDVDNPRIAKDIQFMKDTARFWHDHRDFLFDGEMLKPARLECATRRVEFLRASTYTRPHKSKVCVQEALPCVFHSEWQTKDGRRASVVVNWTRDRQRYAIDFDGDKKLGTLAPLSWALVELPVKPQTLRLLSYNILHGKGGDGQVDMKRTGEAIARERADFVGLQEVDVGVNRSRKINEPEELARLTGLYPTFAMAFPWQGGEYGRAVLSREKPLSVERIQLDGKTPGVLLMCEFPDFWFATMHLFAGHEAIRLRQVGIVRDAVLAKAAAKPVFLTGDWNATPKSKTLNEMREFMTVLSNEKSRTFHGFDYHNTSSEFCIDYIAVDTAHAGRVSVKESHVTTDLETSDHNPVFVSLELK